MESVPRFGDEIPDEEIFVPFDVIADNITGDRIVIPGMGNTTENISRSNLLKRLQPYMNNRAIDDNAVVGLLIAYIILIVCGAAGNGLVCIAVARKPAMRTARNVFIINLAISDLILCLFTMPFSLVEIMMKFWPLGVLPCKLVSGLQATSIFVSTISITAIALDRYKVIVYPTQESCRPFRAFITIFCIWLIALILATPLFLFRTVVHFPVNLPWLKSVNYCIERWPIQHGRGFYSAFSMFFQYLLPIFIVSVAYARICRKLKYRMVAKGTRLQEKQARDKKRVKKTNILLVSIALIFGLSWMPLNILNVVADFFYPFSDNSTFRIVFACCHMAGMSSACSNPLLYGWLNENFKKEFKEIFAACAKTPQPAGRANGRIEGTESFVLYTKNQTNNTNPPNNQTHADTTVIDGVGVRAIK
ncbi:neuropeptide F receptor [Trichonephila inaurata madagascariensis]|uniref:Neuropeptide F receptor n=1 Tax=Trichonephila inaurata madagascariensis TaxID=2747483 RepID=A0A8X6YLA2_9ARAC|nr:neuropeptide F receptor [Trichonephila inaurata madagascariensis]